MTDKEFLNKHDTYIQSFDDGSMIGYGVVQVTDEDFEQSPYWDIDSNKMLSSNKSISIEELKDIISLFEWYNKSKLELKLNPDFKKYQPTEEDREEEINEMKESIIGSEGDR